MELLGYEETLPLCSDRVSAADRLLVSAGECPYALAEFSAKYQFSSLSYVIESYAIPCL